MANSASRVNPNVAAGAVFLITLSLYFVTAAPTFTLKNMGTDGGDLLAAAFNWGVPHPSGYPTYILLLRVFSFLVPVGDFAYRANLFSALLGALTALLMFYVVLKVLQGTSEADGRRQWLHVACASFAALALAASPLIWSQSTIAEVYALNAFFVACLLLLAMKIAGFARSRANGTDREGPSDASGGTVKWLTLMGLLAGLSLGNHLTIVFLLPPLAYWLVATLGWRKLLSPWPVLALILGLMVYVYLPISASRTPVVNWGGADSLKGFLWLTTGGPYQGDFHLLSTGLFGRLSARVGLLFSQLNVAGIFLALSGAFYLRKHMLPLLVATAVYALLVTVYSASYEVRDAQVYMIPVVMVFDLWAGLGLYYLAESIVPLLEERWLALAKRFGVARRSYFIFGPAQSLAIAALVVVPGLTAALNFDSIDLRSDRSDYKHYSEMIGRLPVNAVVMVASDEDSFGMWYLRYVERRRQDVVVVVMPLLQFDWYWNDMHQLFPDRIPASPPQDFGQRVVQIAESNQGEVPIYATYSDQNLDSKLTLAKDGDFYVVEAP